VKPQNWRLTMTIAIIASLVLGLVALGFGIEDLRKINNLTNTVAGLNGSIADSFAQLKTEGSAAAVTMSLPNPGATVSGTVLLDAAPASSNISAVSFVATGGTSNKIQIAKARLSLGGWGAEWTSSNLANGTYQIAAIAYNSEGRHTTSPAIVVTVKNP
jgi:hypothetical protein